MTRNIDVIKAFVSGNSDVHTKNLRIVVAKSKFGDRNFLYSYETPIAVRGAGACGDLIFAIPEIKYSFTTTVHQNLLKRTLQNYDIDWVAPEPSLFKEFVESKNLPTGWLDFVFLYQ